MAAKKVENMSLEESMTELETLVSQLEQGDLPLEQALKQFERGVSLVRGSQDKLQQAEQKVSQLVNSQDGEQLQPLSS